MIKLLHTSDWHLGKRLFERTRYEEHASFLDWLADTLDEERIQIVVIAGDVFDTANPGNQAQQLYYDFLVRVSKTCCEHVVVIGGNHDSASLLEAPRQVLQALNVHVVAKVDATNPESIFQKELLELQFENGDLAMVAAVPYLREGEVRKVTAGESEGDSEEKLAKGICEHYQVLSQEMNRRKQEKLQNGFSGQISTIGLGHLFMAGGKVEDEKAIRPLYIGTLGELSGGHFTGLFDYLALGHLHRAQKVNQQENIRYCGSPIPVGFGEAGSSHKVLVCDFSEEVSELSVCEKEIPTWQKMKMIRGNLEELLAALRELKSTGESIWCEILYEGHEYISDLFKKLQEEVEGSAVEILRCHNPVLWNASLQQSERKETLEELTPGEVFSRRLEGTEFTDSEQKALSEDFASILHALENAVAEEADS